MTERNFGALQINFYIKSSKRNGHKLEQKKRYQGTRETDGKGKLLKGGAP